MCGRTKNSCKCISIQTGQTPLLKLTQPCQISNLYPSFKVTLLKYILLTNNKIKHLEACILVISTYLILRSCTFILIQRKLIHKSCERITVSFIGNSGRVILIFFLSFQGFVPLYQTWESFYSWYVYRRIQDCFCRPVSGVPGAKLVVIDRESNDHRWSFQ